MPGGGFGSLFLSVGKRLAHQVLLPCSFLGPELVMVRPWVYDDSFSMGGPGVGSLETAAPLDFYCFRPWEMSPSVAIPRTKQGPTPRFPVNLYS